MNEVPIYRAIVSNVHSLCIMDYSMVYNLCSHFVLKGGASLRYIVVCWNK
jgi:hypothetical protein